MVRSSTRATAAARRSGSGRAGAHEPTDAPTPAPAENEHVRRLREGNDLLTSAALHRLDADLSWFRSLQAEDRSWIGLVVQSGISSFIAWYADPTTVPSDVSDIFATAPPELTRSISLQHTLQLVRVIVEVVEAYSDRLAVPGGERDLREAVLRYSREVAFSAAEVYARAAEIRGAWDARLEALVVDALVRGDNDDSLRSRVAALGWSGTGAVLVMVGTTTRPLDEVKAAELRRATRRAVDDSLVGIQADRVVLVLGGEGDLQSAANSLVSRFGPGPVVIGPTVASVSEAGTSATAALAALAAARAWPHAPRPVQADDLLTERVLIGDRSARRTLVAQ
ncbi:MAG: PucR family transcriptional regulator, partial [Cellulomonadaceae bacterium]